MFTPDNKTYFLTDTVLLFHRLAVIKLSLDLIGPERGRFLEPTQDNIKRADKRGYLIEECPEGKMLLLYERFH